MCCMILAFDRPDARRSRPIVRSTGKSSVGPRSAPDVCLLRTGNSAVASKFPDVGFCSEAATDKGGGRRKGGEAGEGSAPQNDQPMSLRSAVAGKRSPSSCRTSRPSAGLRQTGERFQGVGCHSSTTEVRLRRCEVVGEVVCTEGKFDCNTLCWVMRSLFDSQSVPDH
jgi:hypothetical protein